MTRCGHSAAFGFVNIPLGTNFLNEYKKNTFAMYNNYNNAGKRRILFCAAEIAGRRNTGIPIWNGQEKGV